MWNRDININLIVNALRDDIEKFNIIAQDGKSDLSLISVFNNSIVFLKKHFLGLNETDILKLLEIMIELYNSNNPDKIEIVLTAPSNFNLKARKTYAVIDEILKTANKSILLTGYSISEYVDDKLDLIIHKSKTGVYISIFINDIKKKEGQLQKLLMYQGKFLKVYDYSLKTDDKMAALHAKVIIVDRQKALITSSNLSYHGIIGNIEMGVLIESEKKCRDIEDIFNSLIRQKVFEKVINTS